MNSENGNSNPQSHNSCRWSMLGYLVAGLGMGAVAGILLAPKSGAETREWIAGKYQDGIDTVNAKVKQTSQRVSNMLDQGQKQVTEAVDAGREAFKKASAAV